MTKQEKALAIHEHIQSSAGITLKLIKMIDTKPKTKRNVLLKSYDRRPMRRQNNAAIQSEIILNALLTALKNEVVISIPSAPTPTYPNGSTVKFDAPELIKYTFTK